MPLTKKAVTLPFEEPFLGLFRSGKAFRTVRENGAASWLLIYNISGKAWFRHAEGELFTNRGDIVLLLPGVRHDYGAGSHSIPYTRLFAHFQPRSEWHDLLQWPVVAPGIKKLSIGGDLTRQRLVRSFKEAVGWAGGHHRRNELFAMNALEKVLLWCDTENPKADSAMDGRIGRALDYLAGNLSKPILLASLARHCGLSVSRFSWLFRHCTGETPQRYLELRRMGRARQLLRFTPNPIKEIAAETGYSDPFYFSLRFKRHTGLSPREFRKKLSREPVTGVL